MYIIFKVLAWLAHAQLSLRRSVVLGERSIVIKRKLQANSIFRRPLRWVTKRSFVLEHDNHDVNFSTVVPVSALIGSSKRSWQVFPSVAKHQWFRPDRNVGAVVLSALENNRVFYPMTQRSFSTQTRKIFRRWEGVENLLPYMTFYNSSRCRAEVYEHGPNRCRCVRATRPVTLAVRNIHSQAFDKHHGTLPGSSYLVSLNCLSNSNSTLFDILDQKNEAGRTDNKRKDRHPKASFSRHGSAFGGPRCPPLGAQVAFVAPRWLPAWLVVFHSFGNWGRPRNLLWLIVAALVAGIPFLFGIIQNTNEGADPNGTNQCCQSCKYSADVSISFRHWNKNTALNLPRVTLFLMFGSKSITPVSAT